LHQKKRIKERIEYRLGGGGGGDQNVRKRGVRGPSGMGPKSHKKKKSASTAVIKKGKKRGSYKFFWGMRKQSNPTWGTFQSKNENQKLGWWGRGVPVPKRETGGVIKGDPL